MRTINQIDQSNPFVRRLSSCSSNSNHVLLCFLSYRQRRNPFIQNNRNRKEVNSRQRSSTYRDSYAFLDIQPISRGHALVIPKEHAVKFHELSDESLADILPVAKKVANALDITNYNLLQNNGNTVALL